MDEKCKKAFEAGITLAKTGKLPEIPTAEEFKELCEKAEHYESGFTIENLTEYLTSLLDREHNYNTIAEAIIAGLRACLKAMDRHENAGITGFQHGWIVHRFLLQELQIKCLKILNYENMLYPQYQKHFGKTISQEVWEFLQKKAKENLDANMNQGHPDVIAHWQSIVDGIVPFGYLVKDD